MKAEDVKCFRTVSIWPKPGNEGFTVVGCYRGTLYPLGGYDDLQSAYVSASKVNRKQDVIGLQPPLREVAL